MKGSEAPHTSVVAAAVVAAAGVLKTLLQASLADPDSCTAEPAAPLLKSNQLSAFAEDRQITLDEYTGQL